MGDPVGMKETIEVLNRMVADGVVSADAIGGAVAAFNYIEPASTDDLDILVCFDTVRASGLVTLTPILTYLKARGYTEFEKEGIKIEGWPVQFLPVASDLDAEALADATAIDIEINVTVGSVPTRVLTAEHVMAKALEIGRPKDLIRISQFIESDAFDASILSGIMERHGLQTKWTSFCARFEITDPCKQAPKP